MAITTRSGKGSPLTHGELDTNFTDLDTRAGDNDTRLTTIENQTLDARITDIVDNKHTFTSDITFDNGSPIGTPTYVTLEQNLVTNGGDLTVTNTGNGKFIRLWNESGHISCESLHLNSTISTNRIWNLPWHIPQTYNSVSFTIDLTGDTLGASATPASYYRATATGPITFDGFESPQEGYEVTIVLTQGGAATWNDSVSAKYKSGLSTLSPIVGEVDFVHIKYIDSQYYINIDVGYS